MAQITRSQGTQVLAQAGRTPVAPVDNQVADSISNLATTGVRIGGALIQQENNERVAAQNEQMRIQKEQQKAVDDLARAKAVNAVTQHELDVKGVSADVQMGLDNGTISYTDAQKAYNDRLSKLPEYQPESRDPVVLENYQASIGRVRQGAYLDVQKAAGKQFNETQKGTAEEGLALNEKLAAAPGANVAQINQDAAARYRIVAKNAGIADDVISKRIRTFQEGNWTNQVNNLYGTYSDDIQGLTRVKSELTKDDGYYIDKLDPERRIAIARQIDGRIDQLETKQTVATARLDAQGKSVLQEVETQISTGILPPAVTTLQWQEKVKGTPAEAEFNQLMEYQDTIQKVVHMPPADQQAFVQALTVKARTEGATVRDQSNLKRLTTALEAQQKLLTDSPLEYNQNLTGVQQAPLSLNELSTAGGLQKVASELKDRFMTLDGLRRINGPTTGMTPFLPQEQMLFKAAYDKGDDTAKLAILGVLSQASGGNATFYNGALKAVAADKPIMQIAGAAAFRNLTTTTGRNVARTILAGDKILTDKSVLTPTENAFAAYFQEAVGNSIPTGPARNAAFAGFKAAYAGMMKDYGVTHDTQNKDVDSKLGDAAFNVVTGGTFDYNNQKVIKPYGWSDDKFEGAVNTSLKTIATNTGYDTGELANMPLIPSGQEGVFFLQNGAVRLGDVNGNPVTVNVNGFDGKTPVENAAAVGTTRFMNPNATPKITPTAPAPKAKPRFTGNDG